MNKSRLRAYARQIAAQGANVQPGQTVILRAGLDQPDFVTMVAEECYKLGAARVRVEWSHQPLDRLEGKKASLEELSKIEAWELEKLRWQAEALPCVIWLDSEDPDGLRGVDQAKLAQARQARYPHIKPLRDRMENKYQWCIAAVPGAAWAKAVFPGLRKGQAIEALWEQILACARTDRWEAHEQGLKAHAARLNGLGLTALRYTAANGTDLTVPLMPESRFNGGGDVTLGAGVRFSPNIPTEEVFTSPRADGAEGTVYATMPLSYGGELIEGFWLKFKEGRVVALGAEKNEALLRQLVAMDEGASRLGECALVPQSSPVRQSGLLFYNTLFDENAACHLALGAGFPDCVAGYETLSREQVLALGLNDSMVHVDFMIGCDSLNIDGILPSGTAVPIFRNGEWA